MARYKDAVEWIAHNDDTESVTEPRVESDVIVTVTINSLSDG